MSRAKKKAEDERELQKAKQLEIERLKKEITNLIELKDKLHKKVQRYHKFGRYLEQVRHNLFESRTSFNKLGCFNVFFVLNSQSVEAADEFQEIREIIDRYETLTTNYKDLLDTEKENEEKLNEMRKNHNSYLEVG